MRGWSVAAKGEASCRNCGLSERLALHHAIPRSICPPLAKRDLRNGLPLCAVCHGRWHGRTLTIYRQVFTEEEWRYLSGVVLTGRTTAGWLDANYPSRPQPPLD